MTMRQADIERAFQMELEANWIATPIVYDNISAPVGSSPWARFYIVPTLSENMTLGSTNQRINREGEATMDVFVPVGSGSRKAQEIADSFLELFENQILDGSLFVYTGIANRIGDSANGWYLVSATINYQAT